MAHASEQLNGCNMCGEAQGVHALGMQRRAGIREETSAGASSREGGIREKEKKRYTAGRAAARGTKYIGEGRAVLGLGKTGYGAGRSCGVAGQLQPSLPQPASPILPS